MWAACPTWDEVRLLLELSEFRAERDKHAVSVPVARHELPVGIPIKSADLTTIRLDGDYVPDSAHTDLEQVVGKKPTLRILTGDYIRSERL